MQKAKSQFIHFKRRFFERTGKDISNKEIQDLILSIKQGRLPLIDRQSNRVNRYRWTIETGCPPVLIDLVLVYDKSRQTLVTILYNNR